MDKITLVKIVLVCTFSCVLALKLPTRDQDIVSGKKGSSRDQLEEMWKDQDPLDALEQHLDRLSRNAFKPSRRLKSLWNQNVKETDSSTKPLSDKCQDMIHQGILPGDSACAQAPLSRETCQQPYVVPGYRLGDLFLLPKKNMTETENWCQAYFPHSIGAQYMQRKTQDRDYKVLEEVLDSSMYAGLERPTNDTIVIHFRGYDVLIPGYLPRRRDVRKYVRPGYYYEKVAREAQKMGFKNAVIVTGDHIIKQAMALDEWDKMPFTKEDAEKGVAKTEEKLSKIKKAFNYFGFTVTERVNQNADCDLVFMASAKAYAPSGGHFDQVIGQLVHMRRGTTYGHKGNEILADDPMWGRTK